MNKEKISEKSYLQKYNQVRKRENKKIKYNRKSEDKKKRKSCLMKFENRKHSLPTQHHMKDNQTNNLTNKGENKNNYVLLHYQTNEKTNK